MSAWKWQKWFLIGAFFLAVIGMNLPVVYTHFYHQLTGAPQAVDGVIDLSTKNLARGRVYLDGQWAFYWNRLSMTDHNQSAEPDLQMSVPDEWSNYQLNGVSLPAGGYGSYKLTLTGLEHDTPVTLLVPDFGGAYRAYVDGQLAANSGRVATRMDQVFTTPSVKLYPVTLSPGTQHEVVIEVATTRFSGLYMVPVLDEYDRALSDKSVRNSARFIFFGVALSLFFSLIFIYVVFVRRKLSSFWLPIMTLLVLLRIMLASELYSFWQPVLFFNLSYESTNELMYLVTFALKYLMLFLVQEQCGINVSRKEKTGFFVYYLLLYLFYLWTPQSVYNQYLSVLVPMLTYVLDIHLFIRIYRDRQQVRKFGFLIFWSFILVIAGLTLESYYINGKSYLDTSLMLPLLLSVFLQVMSWVYAMRIGDLYDDFIESSSRLELAERQMTMQKQYYAALTAQMDTIRVIKHDIRHFVGALNRLADEGKFSELRGFLGEYTEQVETERLPVFCEHAIANSIIGYYYLQSTTHGIPFASKCRIDNQTKLSDSDLCVVLGNALDNAVTACQKMADCDRRFVSIEAGTVQKQWLLKIENSYDPSLLTVDGQGCPVTAQDKQSHGFGMRQIQKLIKSYGGYIRVEYDNSVFALMVAVPTE